MKGIEGSSEYRGTVVRQTCGSLLGRPATEADVTAWTAFLEAGNVEQMRAALAKMQVQSRGKRRQRWRHNPQD